jgi:hypothetical protein
MSVANELLRYKVSKRRSERMRYVAPSQNRLGRSCWAQPNKIESAGNRYVLPRITVFSMELEIIAPKLTQDCWRDICEQVDYNTYLSVRLVSKHFSTLIRPKFPLMEFDDAIPCRDCLSIIWQYIDKDYATQKQLRMVSRLLRDVIKLDFSILRCRLSADVCSEWLKALPVTYLSLRGCENITDDEIKSINQMPITHLDLAHSSISSGQLKLLRGMQIISLNLYCCKNIDNHAWCVIESFPLKELDVYFTKICGSLIETVCWKLKRPQAEFIY